MSIPTSNNVTLPSPKLPYLTRQYIANMMVYFFRLYAIRPVSSSNKLLAAIWQQQKKVIWVKIF